MHYTESMQMDLQEFCMQTLTTTTTTTMRPLCLLLEVEDYMVACKNRSLELESGRLACNNFFITINYLTCKTCSGNKTFFIAFKNIHCECAVVCYNTVIHIRNYCHCCYKSNAVANIKNNKNIPSRTRKL